MTKFSSRPAVTICFVLFLPLLTPHSWGSGWDPEKGLILRGDIVTMDEHSAPITDGQVVIVGEKILAVLKPGEDLPQDVDLSEAIVVETDGWIFPGLIDSHNHTAYNVLPLYEVPRKYDNRYQWTGPVSYATPT